MHRRGGFLLCAGFFVTLFLFGGASLPEAKAATLSRPANNLGLVGYWNFNEGATTQAGDFSGYQRNGAITEASWVAGKLGNALSFDGSNDTVTLTSVPVNTTSNATNTISFWMYKKAGGGNVYSMAVGFTAYDLGFYDSGVNHYFGFNTGAGDLYGITNPGFEDEWVHVVALVRNGDAKLNKIYINGVEQTLSQKAGTTGSKTITQNMRISGWYTDTSYKFNGYIDDVRIYNRALSAAEVAGLYNSGGAKISGATTAVTNGLVSRWTMDGADVSDKVYDRVGGFNGYLVGTNNATSSRKVIGKVGQGFSFGGNATGGVQVGTTANTALVPQYFTIVAWVKLDSQYLYNTIYSNDRDCCGTYNGISLVQSYSGDKLTGRIWNGSQYQISSNADIPTGVWTHVAFTYDGSYKRLYINGSLDNSSAQTVDPGSPASFSTYIGSMGSAGSSLTLDGSLDEVRLYNRGLTAAEIKQIYNEGDGTKTNVNTAAGSLTSGLVGYWPFNGPDVTDAVYDRSGAGHNGYFFGGATSSAKTIGKVGQALQFNGSASQYTDAGGFSDLGTSNKPYAIAAWIKPAASSATGNIIHVSSTTSGIGWCLSMVQIRSGKAYIVGYIGSAVTVTGATTLLPNTWYHIVHTWSPSDGLQLYVNGVLDGSTPQATFASSGASDYVKVGGPASGTACASSAGSIGFNGATDEVRVYNRSLSASEVKQLYNAGK
jgi:hypothetical protein